MYFFCHIALHLFIVTAWVELSQNIRSSKQLITRIKKDQKILSTNINKLQGNLELIKSSNNILNLNKQMRLSESNYKSSDDIFVSFEELLYFQVSLMR